MKLNSLYFYLFLLSYFSFSEVYSQNFNELENNLKNANGKPKIELYLQLSEYYTNNNFNKALDYAKNAELLTEEMGDDTLKLNANYQLANLYFKLDSRSPLAIEKYQIALNIAINYRLNDRIIDLYNVLGMIYQEQGLYYKSIENFTQALYYASSNAYLSDRANLYNNIAISYKNLGDLEKSITYYLKSLEIRNRIEDLIGARSLFNNIGNIYLELENYSKAMEYFEKAYKLTKESDISKDRAKILNNLALVNHKLKNFPKSMEYYQKSIDLKIKLNDQSSLSTSYLNLGSLFLENKDYFNALIQFNHALDLSNLLNNRQVEANTFFRIGDLYLKEENLKAAKDAIDNAFKISIDIKNKYLVKDLFNSYSKYYLQKGDIKKSLYYKDKYIEAKDLIYNIDNNLKLNGMFQRFYLEQKDKELESANKERKIKTLEAQNQKTTLIFLIVFIAILIVFVLFMINRYNIIKRLEQNLEIQNSALIKAEGELKILLDEQKSINLMKSKFITTIAHEFRTPLTAIQNSISVMVEAIKNNDIKIFKRSEEIVNYSMHGLTQQLEDALFIEKNNHNKDTFKPEQINLNEYFSFTIKTQEIIDKQKHLILFEFNKPLIIIEFDKVALERIIVNLISNALKYTPGSKPVYINLYDLGDKIEFSVKDSGIGIPKAEQNRLFDNFQRFSNVGDIKGTGLGLSIVKKVIDFVGGEIIVNSEEGKGTLIRVTLPKFSKVKEELS